MPLDDRALRLWTPQQRKLWTPRLYVPPKRRLVLPEPACAIAHAFTDSKGDTTGPATLSVTKPTGGAPGATDILILAIGSGFGAGGVGSYTAPSGWTSAASLLNQGVSPTFVSGQVFWALGNVSNLGFTKSGNVASAGWIMLCFTGCDTTTPIDATGTANSNTGSSTLTTNAVTIATNNAWHLIGFFDWLGGQFSATNFTLAENANPPTNESAAILYNTTPKSVGSTGTVVVTSSAAASGQVLVGVPFALRPAASARGLFRVGKDVSGLGTGGSYFGNPLG